MKKIFALIIAVVMMLSMSNAAFAAKDDFLSSPSKDLAPELDSYEHEDHDCTGEIVIVSYGDKNTLSDEDKKEFEDAYDSIVNADSLKDLNDKLDGDDLAISDLFGVDLNGCDEHKNHGETTITLDTDSAKNFHSLIAFDGTNWTVVDATLNGNKLTFTTYLDSFTAFAIVVKTADAPQTGDSFSWGYVALMVVSATGFVAVCVSMRKKKD